jgi:hypothetical protein
MRREWDQQLSSQVIVSTSALGQGLTIYASSSVQEADHQVIIQVQVPNQKQIYAIGANETGFRIEAAVKSLVRLDRL